MAATPLGTFLRRVDCHFGLDDPARQRAIRELLYQHFDDGSNCSDVVEFVNGACSHLHDAPELLRLLRTIVPSDCDLRCISAKDDRRGLASEDRVDLVVVSWHDGDSLILSSAIPTSVVVESMHHITSTADLQLAYTMNDGWDVLLALEQPFVNAIMQLLQNELDAKNRSPMYRKRVSLLLKRLARMHGILPGSFMLSGLRRGGCFPVSGGGFSDIWKGDWEGKPVCLKVLRIFTTNLVRRNIMKQLCREALVWKQLKHPNVLPFLGVNEDEFSPSFCLVSPWMGKGDIMKYLESHPDHNRLNSICEIVDGLTYLHSLKPEVIHGDIRGVNILVQEDLTCCLADFGLAMVSETQPFSNSSSSGLGTIRWLAPEVMFPKWAGSDCSNGFGRDIYALGCTMLEIITGFPPFHHQSVEAAVMIDVMNGIRPARPPSDIWIPFPTSSDLCNDSETIKQLCDGLWDLVEWCWAQKASDRPSVLDVRERLLNLRELLRRPESAGRNTPLQIQSLVKCTKSSTNLKGLTKSIAIPASTTDLEPFDYHLPTCPSVESSSLCTPGSCLNDAHMTVQGFKSEVNVTEEEPCSKAEHSHEEIVFEKLPKSEYLRHRSNLKPSLLSRLFSRNLNPYSVTESRSMGRSSHGTGTVGTRRLCHLSGPHGKTSLAPPVISDKVSEAHRGSIVLLTACELGTFAAPWLDTSVDHSFGLSDGKVPMHIQQQPSSTSPSRTGAPVEMPPAVESVQTTRLRMLRNELSESVRENLLWIRELGRREQQHEGPLFRPYNVSS